MFFFVWGGGGGAGGLNHRTATELIRKQNETQKLEAISKVSWNIAMWQQGVIIFTVVLFKGFILCGSRLWIAVAKQNRHSSMGCKFHTTTPSTLESLSLHNFFSDTPPD